MCLKEIGYDYERLTRLIRELVQKRLQEQDCRQRGEEARHRVFDGTISAIGFVKDGTLNKNTLVNTFRALADFYEKEL